MSQRAKKRTVIAACGLVVTGLTSRVFYFQELFFSLLLFAGVFFVLLLLAVIVAGVWMLYKRAVIYLAAWTVEQGHRLLPPVRARLLELAPRVTNTLGTVRSLRARVRSLRLDASHFRRDAERAAKRLLLKHS